jgi:hypothetical protein
MMATLVPYMLWAEVAAVMATVKGLEKMMQVLISKQLSEEMQQKWKFSDTPATGLKGKEKDTLVDTGQEEPDSGNDNLKTSMMPGDVMLNTSLLGEEFSLLMPTVGSVKGLLTPAPSNSSGGSRVPKAAVSMGGSQPVTPEAAFVVHEAPVMPYPASWQKFIPTALVVKSASKSSKAKAETAGDTPSSLLKWSRLLWNCQQLLMQIMLALKGPAMQWFNTLCLEISSS